MQRDNLCVLTIAQTDALQHNEFWTCHIVSVCHQDSCTDEIEIESVRLKVVDNSTFGILPAQVVLRSISILSSNFQEMFHPEMNETFSFLVRSNKVIDTCEVVNSKAELTINTKFDSEECQDYFDATVCVKILQSIPSCIVEIDNMDAELMGTWRFSVTNNDNGTGNSCFLNNCLI